MKVVVLLSKTFFPQHFRAGEANNFSQKVLEGKKKHTCRKNYAYWEEIIGRLKEQDGVLSVRQWAGLPYHKPGQETIVDIPAEVVGVQKLELKRIRKIVQHFAEEKKEPIAEAITYDWEAEIEGWSTPISLIAENDGLTVEEFKAWFSPVFDEAEKKYKELASISNATILDFAIIHFSKERY